MREERKKQPRRFKFSDLGYVRYFTKVKGGKDIVTLRPANPEAQMRFEKIMWGLRQIN